MLQKGYKTKFLFGDVSNLATKKFPRGMKIRAETKNGKKTILMTHQNKFCASFFKGKIQLKVLHEINLLN